MSGMSHCFPHYTPIGGSSEPALECQRALLDQHAESVGCLQASSFGLLHERRVSTSVDEIEYRAAIWKLDRIQWRFPFF